MVDDLPTGNGRVELVAARHIGLVNKGDDLASLVAASFVKDGISLNDSDILVIAQKVVSKSEGRYAYLDEVTPSAKAVDLASVCEKDARLVQLILEEAREVLRCVRNVIVVENHHGVVLPTPASIAPTSSSSIWSVPQKARHPNVGRRRIRDFGNRSTISSSIRMFGRSLRRTCRVGPTITSSLLRASHRTCRPKSATRFPTIA